MVGAAPGCATFAYLESRGRKAILDNSTDWDFNQCHDIYVVTFIWSHHESRQAGCGY
jgi:hypothetical protein